MGDYMLGKFKNKRIFKIMILLFLFFTSFYSFSRSVDARIQEEPEISVNWWDSDWTYCQGIEIYNPGSSLVNYTIPINLSSANYDYSKGKTGGGDLRFLHENNCTLLNFWVESWNYLGSSKIWVEIPYMYSLDLITIFMYYGNDLTSSISNGSSMFEFYEDFSTPLDMDKWLVHEYTDCIQNYTVDDGYLHVYAEIDSTGIQDAGYGFRPNVYFNLENFEIYMSSRWDNLDDYSGQNRWNSIVLFDEDGQRTGLGLAIAVEYRCIYYLLNDGQTTMGDIEDHNNGTSYFEIKNHGNDFNISLSGRYDINYNILADNFNLPFSIAIETIFSDSQIPPVSVDVYYDYIFVRKTTNNEEPTIYFIPEKSTTDVTWMPFSLFGFCFVIVAVIQKRKRKK